MGGQSGTATEASAVDTEVPESSLVVSVNPPEAPTTIVAPTTTAVTTPPPTAAATPSTAPKPSTPTTTAPKAKASPPPTTAAPKVVAPAPPAGPTPTAAEAAVLACVPHRESRGDYGAVDPTGQFMGAYQIYQGGWDTVARSMGRTDLVGRRPNTVA